MRPKVKYAVIYRHRNEYSVSVMCKFFEVSRSGCYDFVRRIGQTESDAELAKKIQECQGRADKPYGYRLKLNISYIGPFCAVRINWGSPAAGACFWAGVCAASRKHAALFSKSVQHCCLGAGSLAARKRISVKSAVLSKVRRTGVLFCAG